MAAWDASAWADAVPWQSADALLVLAGGVDEAGAVHETVARRLDAAAELCRRALASGRELAVICNGGGTSHKPRFRDEQGFAVPESELMSRALKQRGVPAGWLYLESLSDDTIGNAYAARTLHCEWRPWRRLLLITSDFQLARAEAVYRWIFSLPPVVAEAYTLTPCGVPDEGTAEAEVLASRSAREQASLAAFLTGTSQKYTTMAAVQKWLFTEHGAYAPRSAPRPVLDAAALKTY
jgi:DUF218 domain